MSAPRSPEVNTSGHLGRLAEDAWTRLGDYPALFFDGEWHSSTEIFERSCRIGGGLIDLGLQPGDRVVVTMPNSPDVPVLYQAIWRAGGVVTPVLGSASAKDLAHVVADSEARLVVTSADLLEKVTTAAAASPATRVVCNGNAAGDAISLSSLEQADRHPIVDREKDDLAALLYTGGTTGRSKGVMLSHSALAFAAWAVVVGEEGLGLEQELLALPLAHSFGLVEMLAALQSGLRKVWVLVDRFDPDTVLDLAEENRIQKMQAVPSMIQLLLSHPIETKLAALRYIGCGGAPLPPEVINEVAERLPALTLVEGYGLTECASIATANPPGAGKVGSVGPAMHHIEVRIEGAEGWLAANDVGEICVKSPSMMTGYWREPELTSEVLRDGWLRTGDVGYLDEDDYVYILDRKKDVIIRGGFNVFPRDVEDSLVEHPAISMAAVVGKPDRIQGEEVVAFVTVAPGLTTPAPSEIVDWARDSIGGYKYPREVHILDSMPLTGVGKVDRKALRAQVSER